MDSLNCLNKFEEIVSTRVLELCYEHITKFARELDDDVIKRIFTGRPSAEIYKQGMFDAAGIILVALIARQKRLENPNPATNERKDDGTPQEATENS